MALQELDIALGQHAPHLSLDRRGHERGTTRCATLGDGIVEKFDHALREANGDLGAHDLIIHPILGCKRDLLPRRYGWGLEGREIVRFDRDRREVSPFGNDSGGWLRPDAVGDDQPERRQRQLDRLEIDALVIAVHSLAVALVRPARAEQPEAVGRDAELADDAVV